MKKLDELASDLDLNLRAAISIATRGEQVRVALFERAQGHMVQELQNFLDECYLQLLIEVITEGNRSGLKLRKANIKLNPGTYVPADADSDTAGWFTLRVLVSDMWRDYKFEPFPEKLTMLRAARVQVGSEYAVRTSAARVHSELYSTSRGIS